MLSSRRCCKPLGPPAAVFLLVASGEVQLCVSGDIYAEYEEVVRRPRLARDEEIIITTLQTIREKGFWVRPIRISRSRGLFGDRQSQALSPPSGRVP
jgi:predicted nucleic acid-binding protein